MGSGGTAATGLAVSLPVTVSGALNMSGATLTVPTLTLSGTLTSQGGTGFGDTIMTPGGGGLTNNGTIQYSGALHTLALAGPARPIRKAPKGR